MTLKEVSSVIDDINEWNGPNGTVYYVTAMFTDETVGSVGRKDHDAALEVQGLLREAIGVIQDFTLESKGQTKTGREKFNIKGFGTPGGAATYTAPGVQGGGAASGLIASSGSARARPPEHDVDDPRRSKEEMRRSEALRAAASFLSMSAVGMEKVLEVAEFFEEWLERKTSGEASVGPVGGAAASPESTSEPASSAYKGGDPASTVAVQAGAGSEDCGEEVGESAVDHLGEGTSASSPHSPWPQPDNPSGGPPPAAAHIHDYQPAQGGFLICVYPGCRKMRKKETV
jgi:hypothetical protein